MLFIIKKSKWLRNQEGNPRVSKKYTYPGGTLLDPSSNKMCCLGFCALQLGVPRKLLKDVGMPSEVGVEKGIEVLTTAHKTKIGKRYFLDSKLSQRASNINDDESITDEEKINLLTKLFKKHGHTIEFV